MKTLSTTFYIALLFTISAKVSYSQCSPDITYANEDFGLFPDTVGVCSPTFTFNTLTDSIYTFGGSLPDITFYLDAFKVLGVSGLPQNVSWQTDAGGQNGIWYNTGSVPNQNPIQGCVELSGQGLYSLSPTGGPNGDGVYPFQILVDARVADTEPDFSFLVEDSSWLSTAGSGLQAYAIDLFIKVDETNMLSVVSQGFERSCYDSNDASISVEVSGFTDAVLYQWTGSCGQSGSGVSLDGNINLTGLDPSCYSYTIAGQDSGACGFFNGVTFEDLAYHPYQNEELCLVTVDSGSGMNQVQWEKTAGVDTDYFIVYKQNSSTSFYDSIGFVDFNDLSVFTDMNSNPAQQSDRYRIRVVDVCGSLSSFSQEHRTIHLSANQGINAEVNLSWNAYEGFSYSNFTIFRNNNGVGFVPIGSVANNTYSYTDLNPPAGTNYYRIGVVNQVGCVPSRSASSSYSNVIDDSGNAVITSIREAAKSNVSVFPNPSNGLFTVSAAGMNNVQVFNSVGILIDEYSKNSDYLQIDLSDESQGIYTLRLRTESGWSVKKIVKQ